MKNIASLLLFTAVSVLFFGCTEQSTTSPTSGPKLGQIMEIPSSHPLDPFISQYTASSVIGFVQAKHVQYNILNGTAAVTGTLDDCACVVVDPSDPAGYGVWEYPSLNGALMRESGEGSYQWIRDAMNPLQIYFDGQYNIFETDSGAMYQAIRDSVQFGTALTVTSHVYNASISKAQGTTVQWQGCGSDFVEVKFTRHLTEIDQVDSTSSVGFHLAQSNTGQIVLPASRFSQLDPGTYNLRIAQYEPKLITLPSGKNIYVIGQSEHEITVQLTQ